MIFPDNSDESDRQELWQFFDLPMCSYQHPQLSCRVHQKKEKMEVNYAPPGVLRIFFDEVLSSEFILPCTQLLADEKSQKQKTP